MARNFALALVIMGALLFAPVQSYAEGKSFKFPRLPYDQDYKTYGLQGYTELEKDKVVTLMPKETIPFSSNGSRLCFVLGYHGLDEEKTFLAKIFGNEELDKEFTYSPLFIRGEVQDSQQKNYKLSVDVL